MTRNTTDATTRPACRSSRLAAAAAVAALGLLAGCAEVALVGHLVKEVHHADKRGEIAPVTAGRDDAALEPSDHGSGGGWAPASVEAAQVDTTPLGPAPAPAPAPTTGYGRGDVYAADPIQTADTRRGAPAPVSNDGWLYGDAGPTGAVYEGGGVTRSGVADAPAQVPPAQAADTLAPPRYAPGIAAAPAAVPAPTAPAPAPVPFGAQGHFVQLGAFLDPLHAEELRLVADTWAGGRVRVTEFASAEGVFRRVRLGPYASETEALDALRLAKALGHIDAMLVRP